MQLQVVSATQNVIQYSSDNVNSVLKLNYLGLSIQNLKYHISHQSNCTSQMLEIRCKKWYSMWVVYRHQRKHVIWIGEGYSNALQSDIKYPLRTQTEIANIAKSLFLVQKRQWN